MSSDDLAISVRGLGKSYVITPLAERTNRTGNGRIRFTSFHVEDADGTPVTHVASGRDTCFVLSYELSGAGAVNNVDVGISVHSRHDTTLFVIYSSYTGGTLRVERRSGAFRCTIPRLPLTAGSYHVGARVTIDAEEADWPRDSVGAFFVEEGDFYGSGQKGCAGATSFLIDGKWGVR